MLGLSFVAILLDPDTTFSRKRKIQGSGDGHGDGGAHSYKVKRPLIGFKRLRCCVETPAGMADVWWDGICHERAVF